MIGLQTSLIMFAVPGASKTDGKATEKNNSKNSKNGIILENEQILGVSNNSSINDKINFTERSIIFTKINSSNDQEILSFLNRENLYSYETIKFQKSQISSDLLDIIASTLERFQGIIVEFEECDINESIHSLSPENFSIVIDKTQYIGPNSIHFKIPIEISSSIFFVKNGIIIDSLDVSQQKNIDCLVFLANQKIPIQLIKLIGDPKKVKIDGKFLAFLDILKTHHPEFRLFDGSAFALTLTKDHFTQKKNRDFFSVVGLNIFFQDKHIQIPSTLARSIEFNTPGVLTINSPEVAFFTKSNKEVMTFFNECFSFLPAIELSKCKINRNFLSNLSELKSTQSKILKFTECVVTEKSLLEKIFQKAKENPNLLIKWGNQISFGNNEFGSLEINTQNIKNVESILSIEQFKISTLLIKNLDLNAENAEIINGILMNHGKNINTIKFVGCEFSNTFLKCIDTIKSNRIPVSAVFFLDIIDTPSANLVATLFKQMGSAIYYKDINLSRHTKQSKNSKNTGNRYYSEHVRELIDMATKEKNYGLETLINLCAMEVGFPGEVKAKSNNEPFPGFDVKKVENDIRSIINSWIVGYDKEKTMIVNTLMSFMENKGMGKDKYILLFGPPGIGKTTFIYAIAAVLKYIDTGKIEDCLYDPRMENNKVKDWYFIIPGAEINDKGGLIGFQRTYKDSSHGMIITALKTNNLDVFTKVVAIDELDKIGKKDGSNLIEVFTGLLEPTQRKRFFDVFLVDKDVDLSQVFIIATANKLEEIPSHIKNRFTMIEIPPLSMNSFIEMAMIKWNDICQKHNIKKTDYTWDSGDFNWFVENIGPNEIRSLLSNFESLASKISLSKKNGESIKITKEMIMSMFKQSFNKTPFVENKSGYSMATLLNNSGSYSNVWIIANAVGRDRGEHINLVCTSTQNRDQGVHGIKVSIQSTVHSILQHLQQSGVLDGFKVKMNQSFVLGMSETFNLDDFAYFCTQGVLSIVSQITMKDFSKFIAIGATDVAGRFYGNPESEEIAYRVGNALNSKTTTVKKIFLPGNLSNGTKEKVMDIIENWIKIHKIEKKNMKILFVSDIKDIVSELLEETDQKNN